MNSQDIFILGGIHVLKSIMKAIEKTPGETPNDIDFQEVLEIQRRDLSDPELEECIVDATLMEALR